MALKQEQLNDIEWARAVLAGQGDEHDSASHAEWMLDKLCHDGVDEDVRSKASQTISAIEGSHQ